MRAASDFKSVMRRGHKSGRKTVVVYMSVAGDAESIAGFAVSKAVGGAVTRNRVKRRLRAIASEILPTLPEHTSMVVRALPTTATATFSSLNRDVRSAASETVNKANA